MENGGQSGARSDHERDIKANGGNGTPVAHELGKESAAVPAGDKDKVAALERTDEHSLEKRSGIEDLPEEIQHITEGFVPLSRLLTRLAQNTHNELQNKILELAKLPVPGAVVNGNAAHGVEDDASTENLRKKGELLRFAQDQHGRWVKALVLAEWSRKADVVSKLIDLKVHLQGQKFLYDEVFRLQVDLTAELRNMRLPSPDLKTALQILSTGSAPYMPDVSLRP